MTDRDLRSKLIRLAHKKPEFRGVLLPILDSRVASKDLKSLVVKMVASAGKKLKAFAATVPVEAYREVGVVKATVESPPPRGGYGPFEKGEITIGKYLISVTGDHSNGTVTIGVRAGGSYVMESLYSKGPAADAPARLKKVLSTIEGLVSANVGRVMEKVPQATSNPIDSVEDKLKSMRLGPGGRVRSVERDSPTEWTVEPTNRLRLDHYSGDDEDGWNEDGWREDYADPVEIAAQGWLEQEFGAGLFEVTEVGEKGHVHISLTPKGKQTLKGASPKAAGFDASDFDWLGDPEGEGPPPNAQERVYASLRRGDLVRIDGKGPTFRVTQSQDDHVKILAKHDTTGRNYYISKIVSRDPLQVAIYQGQGGGMGHKPNPVARPGVPKLVGHVDE